MIVKLLALLGAFAYREYQREKMRLVDAQCAEAAVRDVRRKIGHMILSRQNAEDLINVIWQRVRR